MNPTPAGWPTQDPDDGPWDACSRLDRAFNVFAFAVVVVAGVICLALMFDR